MDPMDEYLGLDEWLQGGSFTSPTDSDVLAQTNVASASENSVGHAFQPHEEQGTFVYPVEMNQSPLNVTTGEHSRVLSEIGSEHHFQAPGRQGALGYSTGMNLVLLKEVADENYGGLMDNIAATNDFSSQAMWSNTQSIQPQSLSYNTGMLSPSCTNYQDLVSPSVLLDYPNFTNPPVLPSPAAGNYAFMPTENNQNSTPTVDDIDMANNYQDFNASQVGFGDTNSLSYFNDVDQVNSQIGFCPQTYTNPTTSYTSFQPQVAGTSKTNSQSSASSQHTEFSELQNMKGGNYLSSEQTRNACGVIELSPTLDQPNEDGVHQSSKDPNSCGDGYYWKKYFTKHVKSSEYPRSYYRCTQNDCPAKKIVERTSKGIMETPNGSHNHPKPHSSVTRDMPLPFPEPHDRLNGDIIWSSINIDNSDPMSSIPHRQAQYDTEYDLLGDSLDDVDVVEEDEALCKTRRTEIYTPEMGSSRATKEPKIVIRTKSEVDVLDDGFCWHKYGQKVGKGNPNPRSYYKCISGGCNVRKHVERASNDPSYVITTYRGKHKHGIPRARIDFGLRGSNSFPVYESSQTLGGTSHQLSSSGVQDTDTSLISNFNYGMNHYGTTDNPETTDMSVYPHASCSTNEDGAINVPKE